MTVVEIAPQPALSGPLNRIAAEAPGGGAFPVISAVHRGECTPEGVRRTATRLLAAAEQGAVDSWFPTAGTVTDLPSYPWQRQRYWHGTPEHWIRTSGDGVLVHPLLGERLPALDPLWQSSVERTRTPWLADHRIGGTVVMPAAGFVELALAAAREVSGAGIPAEIDDLQITRALALPWDAALEIRLQTCLSHEDGIFHIASRTGETGAWRQHARGRVRRLAAVPPDPAGTAALFKRLPRRIDADTFYSTVAQEGLDYGPAFQVLSELHVGAGEVLAVYHCEAPDDGYGGYVVHPALLDGALQTGAPLLMETGTGYLPAAIDRIRQWAQPGPDGLVHVRQRSRTTREAVWDITVTDTDGTVALELTGCRLHRIGLRATDRGEEYTSVLHAAPLAGQPVPAWAPPSPGEVAAAAEEGLLRLQGSAATNQFVAGCALLRSTTATYAVKAFASLLPGHETFTFDDLAAAGVLPRHERLVHLLARMAETEGLLARGNGCWRRLREDARVEPPAISVLSDLASWTATGCLNHRFALDLLFQDSGPELIQQFYDLDPPTRFHNRIAAELLASLLRLWPGDRPLRILEVGAGTGGLTAHLLPLLDHRATYVFTDVSAAFFPAAQARFEAHASRMSFRTLDLDADFAAQGFEEGSFDVLVAGYALHAAADLRACLPKLARLTAPGGYLLALEVHDPQLLALMFGVIENFWNPRDHDLRPDTILLPRRQWSQVLADSGFESTVELDDPSMSEHFSVLFTRTSASSERVPAAPPATPEGGRSWILLAENADEAELARLVAEELIAAGRPAADAPWCLREDQAWQAALAHAPDADIALILSSTGDLQATDDPEAGVELAVRRAGLLRSLVHAEQQRAGSLTRRLVLVTHPSGALPAPERPAFPGQAAAWGISRTLAHEHAVPMRRISLDRTPDLVLNAARLARELLAGEPADADQGPVHDEVALTSGGRFAHCVERSASSTRPTRPDSGSAFRLELQDQGPAFRLRWIETTPGQPGPQEVVIAVRAAALNYRDVMVATGLLPPVAENGLPSETFLGLEGAGVVTAVGESVTGLSPGDRVFGLFLGAFASHVRVPAAAVRPIPDGMSFTAAATMPVAYFTVHHSLEHLARLQPGETLLVHGATGGVGLAALCYAHRVGARLIVTAGSPAKRDMASTLGAELVLDSRTLDFADEIRRHTEGRGVDVILNSLSGEAAARSRELLALRGRFVELGKRDIYSNQRLLQKALAENATLFIVDAANLLWQDRRHAVTVFDEVAGLARAGTYLPLPHQTYPAHRISEAFRLMQHSRHIGKIVIGFDDPVPVHRTTPQPLQLDGKGTYLVTGGLSGFGAETARWLTERGARHLALVSRRGPQAPEAEQLLADLHARGAQARAHAADIADATTIRALLQEIASTGHPVRGIVHAAMHVDDGAFAELDDDRIRSVLAPKWGGALVLDALCPDADLLLYSSISPLLGSPGQSSYAAANLAMEALARHRRAAGRPALAVAWGAIDRVGYVARNGLTAHVMAMGSPPMDPLQALTTLDGLIHRRVERAVFARLDWQRFSALIGPGEHARFAAVLPAPVEGSAWQLEEFMERLTTAGAGEALTLVEDFIAAMAAKILQMPPDKLDRHRPLIQYGMDSLMGLELLAKCRAHFKQEVPVMELLHSDGSTHGIAEIVLPHLLRQAHTQASTVHIPRRATGTQHIRGT
ncbi:SDR family NAD(P)-dependent oxidoreductase [Streptomyces roseifaciens]|uniref:SDR family NAD(P)-dependent oxidoreductase n=1 Tax=Streptomyces roseifaciens TaxID=1488406 RepID=UPI0009A04F67|nr:SDR family NAD(P)-dependent oxidoreductase [Streptomyces roseifaciens]